MIFGIAMLIALWMAYQLLIKGFLWKLIVSIFGWLGMYWFFDSYIPSAKTICVTLGTCRLSYSEVIPTILIILAMAYTKDE